MLEESYQAGVDAFAKDPRVPPEAFKDLADQLGALKLIDAAAAQKRRSRLTTTTAKSMSWRKPVSSNGLAIGILRASDSAKLYPLYKFLFRRRHWPPSQCIRFFDRQESSLQNN